MIESTLTSKGQTTVPKAVRTALRVGPGDRIRYVISAIRCPVSPASAPP